MKNGLIVIDEVKKEPVKGAPGADLGALAAQTASETEKALPPGGAGQGSAGGAPVDAYGRTFDASIHQTKLGEGGEVVPVIHPRRGTLMCLPGRGLGADKKIRPKATGAEGSTLDIHEGQQQGQASPAPGGATGQADAGQLGQQQQAAQLIGPTPEEMARHARADATAWRKFARFIGRALAGADEGEYQKTEHDDEASDVQDSMHDYLEGEGIRLPIGNLGLVIISTGGYWLRCWQSEKNQERIDALLAKLQGKEPEQKPRAAAAAPEASPRTRDQQQKSEALAVIPPHRDGDATQDTIF